MADELKMGLGEAEGVLLTVHDIPRTAEKAFRSRIAHLQRAGFPAAAKVGQFARASYGLEELLQLSVVFSLVQAYVPPVVGRRVVTEFWPEIARLLIAALSRRGIEGLGKVPTDAPLIMTLIPHAMRDIGADSRKHGKGGVDQGGFDVRLDRGAEGRERVDTDAQLNADSPATERPPVTVISIDFCVLADRLVDALGPTRLDALRTAAAAFGAKYGW